MANNSKNLIVRGVVWSAIQMVIKVGFTFVVKLVLAKLLFPEDFGIVGMATVFTGFVQVLNDLGIAAALVQRKEEDLEEHHFHTAFWTGILWAISLYLIMCFVVGPLASDFYDEPILLKLIPVMSLGILASPVNMIHKAQLTRAMDFKKIAITENIAAIVSGILSIIMAFMGAGVWALVFNTVSIVIFTIPFYFKATKYIPRFSWKNSAFKDIFGFGVFTAGTSIINYAIGNVDYLMIGKFLSASALGVYTFAFVLTDTFRNRMMTIINNVMYPMYGKNQANPETLKRHYLKVVNYNAIAIYPIMLIFIILGKPIIINFFGDKWEDAIIPLQILSGSVMVHMLVNSNTSLIRGMGRPLLELKLQAFKGIIFIPMLIFGILYYGIIGAAVAVLINKVIAVIIAQFTFNRILNIKISTLNFFHAIKVPWIASVISGTIAYILYFELNTNFIFVAIILIGIYLTIVWFLMKKDIILMIKSLKSLKNKKFVK